MGLGNLIEFLDFAFNIYVLLLIVRILSSWFPAPNSPGLRRAVEILHELTEPVLGLFRRLLPQAISGGAGIDFSPIVAILALQIGWSLLRSVLVQL